MENELQRLARLEGDVEELRACIARKTCDAVLLGAVVDLTKTVVEMARVCHPCGCRCRHCHPCPAPEPLSTIRWTLNGVTFEGRNVHMNLRESEKVSGTFVGHKPDGSVGSIDGPVVVVLDPPDSLDVQIGPDGSGSFVLLGKPQSDPAGLAISVTVTADVDPNTAPDAQKFLTAAGAILLLPDLSTTAEIQFGTPEPK